MEENNTETNKKEECVDEQVTVHAEAHILIRVKGEDKILLNKRG